MMSPLEEAFRNRLALFKEQKHEVSKEQGVLKRLQKLRSNVNNFAQKRQMQHTLVKSKSGDGASEGVTKIANYVPGAKALIGTGAKIGQTGSTKILAEGSRWTTSGYKPFSFFDSASKYYAPMNLKGKVQNKKKE